MNGRTFSWNPRKRENDAIMIRLFFLRKAQFAENVHTMWSSVIKRNIFQFYSSSYEFWSAVMIISYSRNRDFSKGTEKPTHVPQGSRY